MPTLLVSLKGNKTFNRTFFPPRIYIYDDLLKYKRRHWLRVKEMTISYDQISQFTVTKGILFGFIEILTTGNQIIEAKFVSKKGATLAKSIVDQKIFHAHAKHQTQQNNENNKHINELEKSLNRLQELLNRGHISDREYEKRKSKLIKKFN